MPTKQAAAAVGQCELMYAYDRLFSQHNHTVAQLLLTGSDIEDEKRRANFTTRCSGCSSWARCPSSTKTTPSRPTRSSSATTTRWGAIVAQTVQADLLILLSDIDGLYTADPRRDPKAELIPVVESLTPEILALAGGNGTSLGTGGMVTKLRAARIACEAGIDMVIANGVRPADIYRILDGEPVGTRFIGRKRI